MMKKALWALALLFLVSGCNDNDDYQSPTRPDNLVNTTFTFEYNLNYVTPTLEVPDPQVPTYSTAPAMPSTLSVFRVVMELYEEMEDPNDPGAEPTYRYYGRKTFYTNRHKLGDNGNLALEGEWRLHKIKYKAVVWADYVLNATTRVDRYFVTNNTDNGKYMGLRMVAEKDLSASNTSFINEGALGGIHTFDLTSYVDDLLASHDEDISVDRKIGGVYLVANDLAAYSAQATPARPYEVFFRPTRADIDFGTYNSEDPESNAGYSATFDVWDNEVTGYASGIQKSYKIGQATSADKLTIANYFMFASESKTKQDMTISIYGPSNGKILSFEIKGVGIAPNKLLYVEGPFLTGEGLDGILDDSYEVRVVDRFDGKDEIISDIDWYN